MTSTARPFGTLPVGCSFCVYAMPPPGPLDRPKRTVIPLVPKATQAVSTRKGIRLLCDAHAAPFFAPKCDPDPHAERAIG